MVLWGKSKEMKPPTDLERELRTTEVVVMSANEKSDHVSSNVVNSKSNIVTKTHKGIFGNGDHEILKTIVERN